MVKKQILCAIFIAAFAACGMAKSPYCVIDMGGEDVPFGIANSADRLALVIGPQLSIYDLQTSSTSGPVRFSEYDDFYPGQMIGWKSFLLMAQSSANRVAMYDLDGGQLVDYIDGPTTETAYGFSSDFGRSISLYKDTLYVTSGEIFPDDRSGNIYHGALHAIDLNSGRMLWRTTSLSGRTNIMGFVAAGSKMVSTQSGQLQLPPYVDSVALFDGKKGKAKKAVKDPVNISGFPGSMCWIGTTFYATNLEGVLQMPGGKKVKKALHHILYPMVATDGVDLLVTSWTSHAELYDGKKMLLKEQYNLPNGYYADRYGRALVTPSFVVISGLQDVNPADGVEANRKLFVFRRGEN